MELPTSLHFSNTAVSLQQISHLQGNAESSTQAV